MTDRERRCEDCVCLVTKSGKMYCDECSMFCNDVAECPEGVTLEEVVQLNEKAKNVKIDHQTEKATKGQKKEKIVKVSDEKVQIFSDILGFLSEKYSVEVVKPNKLVKITIDSKTFTVDLIENRQKK